MDFFLDFEKLAIARGLLDLTTLILQTSCNSLLTLLLPEQDTQVAARSGQDLFIHVRWLSGYVISREIFHLKARWFGHCLGRLHTLKERLSDFCF